MPNSFIFQIILSEASLWTFLTVSDISAVLTCKISKKGIFLYKSQKNFFLLFMGDESPNA